MHTSEEIGKAVHAAVEAAAWAPSVHNTQPWSFVVSGEEISVRSGSDRRLPVEDPAGQEMLISCGAALFNVRLALLELGYEPVVQVLPDPDRRALLATVRPGAAVATDEHTRLLHAQIERRRTHRGDFTGEEPPDRLVEAVCREAAMEGARLTPVRSASGVRVLTGARTVPPVPSLSGTTPTACPGATHGPRPARRASRCCSPPPGTSGRTGWPPGKACSGRCVRWVVRFILRRSQTAGG
ncbi:nitroreductase [Planomonospora sphaerica]|uniref:Nitroreductase n=1 Tax=Planomonospora sphaerica TaxID=161355 RepID=A0A161LLR8_9ACTN|nr:hypothetical protein [Planomonospora sphaerica]GAT69847.1 nitroreductase [Planomonospora sphaerica]